MASDRSKEIFLDAIEVEPSGRGAYIDDACGADRALNERVRALLAAHQAADRVLIEPTTRSWTSGLTQDGNSADGEAAATHPSNDPAEWADRHTPGPGARIGPYVIDRILGEGGFGTVYLAHQQVPVKRRVALKVIRPGMDSRDVVRRFELERQALAVMDHPGIAKVFDAGTTAQGRPYVAMEYLDGRPINEFCDAQRLGIRARLELFEDVCLAVQHAHGKGVIHRDLKPSNVLVSVVDGKPFPKVIDFGIAKAVGERFGGLGAHTRLLTLPQQIVGTPQYMAPEQATLDVTDVDTRADVYSLGVILYELLTGATTFDANRLRGLRPSELERIICEEEPPRPSSRVEMHEDGAGQLVAQARSVDSTARLARLLAGDLDWICFRALEKDRARRYAAALTLAADVRRYLQDEPVEACPPTLSYRVSKFARRHRVEFAAGAAVALALVAFACGSAWFAFREYRAAEQARRQLARADALATFSQDILTGIDPAEARGMDTGLLRKILSGAVAKVDAKLGDQPEAAASMLNAIGYAFMQIGDFPESERHFRQAMARLAAAGVSESPDALKVTESLSAALVETQQYAEAEQLLTTLLKTRRRTQGEDHVDTIVTLGNLGYLYTRQARWDEARPIFEQVLDAHLRARGPAHESTLTAMNNLASVLDDLGDRQRSIELLEQVVRGHIANHGETWPKALLSMNNLAASYHGVGRNQEARATYRRVLEIKRKVYGPDHVSTIITMTNLGSLELDLGDDTAAEKLYLEAVDAARKNTSPTDVRRVAALNGLGRVYRVRGQHDRAVPLIAEAVEVVQAAVPEGHPDQLKVIGNLATVMADAKRPAEAERHARRAMEIARKHNAGPEHIMHLSRILARTIAAQDRNEEAAVVLRDLLDSQPPIDMPVAIRAEIARDLVRFAERAGDQPLADRWRAAGTTTPTTRAQ